MRIGAPRQHSQHKFELFKLQHMLHRNAASTVLLVDALEAMTSYVMESDVKKSTDSANKVKQLQHE